ncbi:MAG: 2-hydroxyacyl-CoA dehydratase, partial [Dethiobacter sp.]|nr:2-hydroxyacyl-CoA dehydratase [Dethiobacter sp.]
MVNELRGLARARYIASNREELIRERKRATGKPVIGYLCCFAPPEIISAAGAIPYRITGRPGEATAEADAYMEPYGCSYVRNILAQAAKDRYDFLDGLVISHSCDMVQRLYGIWSYYRPTAYSRLFNVPHQVSLQAQRFFQRELSFFKESLERFT